MRNDVRCILFLVLVSFLIDVPEASDGEPLQLVIAGIAYWRSTNVCVSVDSCRRGYCVASVARLLVGRSGTL